MAKVDALKDIQLALDEARSVSSGIQDLRGAIDDLRLEAERLEAMADRAIGKIEDAIGSVEDIEEAEVPAEMTGFEHGLAKLGG